MRFFLISLFSLLFLSGCGEPSKGFIGKWNIIGSPQRGIVIQEGGKGFAFREDRSPKDFTWSVENGDDGIYLEVDGLGLEFGVMGADSYLGSSLDSIRLDGSYLKSDWYRFERAK